MEAHNLEAYKKTGEFPEGSLIVKELTLVLKPTFPDGSRTEPSGRGYFNGAFNGIDATVKNSKRFSKTKEAPVSERAGCHMANAEERG